MNDATVSWSASLAGTPTGYVVQWSQNGTPIPPNTVAANSAQDTSGYSQDFATANPLVAVNPGDVIGVTVQAVDATNNLSSSAVPSTPPTVTEPTAPVAPGDPQNVTLVLS